MSKDKAKSTKKQARQPWIVRTPVDFYLIPMSDRARCMLQILEGIARRRPFCFPGNARLAKMTGKKLRTIQETLEELERGSWIKRIYEGDKRRTRIGIIMLNRIDPKMPAADTREKLADAEAKLRERGNPHAVSAESRIQGVRIPAPEEGRSEQGRREEGIKEAHVVSSSTKRTFFFDSGEGEVKPGSRAAESEESPSSRDRLVAATFALGRTRNEDAGSVDTRWFSSLCLSVINDQESNRGCFMDLGRKIAAKLIDPEVFVDCVDKSILHVAQGNVKHQPKHFMAMLANKCQKSVLDDMMSEFRSDPAKAMREHCSTPVTYDHSEAETN